MSAAIGRFGRPSQRRLETWLDTHPEKFERYLASHPEIAERFDADNPLSGLGSNLRAALDEAVTAPIDLAARIRAQIFDPGKGTSPVAIGLDLLGVGTETLRLLSFGTVPDERTDDAKGGQTERDEA